MCLILRFNMMKIKHYFPLLFQTITYGTKEKKNIVKNELFKMKGPCISRGGTGLWNNESIDLPQDLPPTKLAGRSQLINVEYNLDVWNTYNIHAYAHIDCTKKCKHLYVHKKSGLKSKLYRTCFAFYLRWFWRFHGFLISQLKFQ